MKYLTKSLNLWLVFAVCAVALSAQTTVDTAEEINFGYSQNPRVKSAKPVRDRVIGDQAQVFSKDKTELSVTETAFVKSPVQSGTPKTGSGKPAVSKTAQEKPVSDLRPTEIYKVGIGDVLHIGLRDSRSSNFTVLATGSIDYPLAGGMVEVNGLTVVEIEKVLNERIQLYQNPEVSVKVREYASHVVEVSGMVTLAGKQFLLREAMPLFVIRAQAVPDPGADMAVITRDGSEPIEVRAGEAAYDDTLVFQGDKIEFTSAAAREGANGYVYVGGEIPKTGRIGYQKGMTLTQAIIESVGAGDGKIKKIIVRRKDDQGYLNSRTYKYSDIRKGKVADPELAAGDMIEIGS